MKKLYIFLQHFVFLVLFFVTLTAFSQQSVSIGTSTTNKNAVLLLFGDGKQGLIIPVTTTPSSIPATEGMVVYNSTDKKVYYSDGSTWAEIGKGTAGATPTLAINGNQISIFSGTNVNLAATNPAKVGQLFMWDGAKWTTTSGAIPPADKQVLKWNGTTWAPADLGSGGTVTAVSVTTSNGVSGTVLTSTTTPAISLTLGAITPTSVAASGTITGANLSGTNTGDQTNITGNAATVTTNANLTGPVTSTGNVTSIAAGVITNTMLAGSIVEGKLSFSDILTGNFSTAAHGFVPKGTNVGNFLKDDGTWATPGGGGDMVLASTQTNTGAKSFNDGTLLLGNVGNSFFSRFTNTATAARVYTLKDASGTIAFTSDITGINSGTNTGDQINITGNAATVTTNANLTGPVTSVGNATTVAAGGITNAMLANVATATFKGRTTAGTGVSEDLTVAQAKALLNLAGTNTGDQTTISGNAGTATALATGRTIAITGDVTYTSPLFDGSTNVTAASTVTRINSTLLSGLGTGLLKNTTGTGVPSIALNSDLPAMTATVGGAVPTPPNNTTTFLRGDGTFATPAGGGTVTAVSVATANGFSGTSSGGATPALTIIAGAIVPTSVNSVVLSGSATPTLAVTGTTSVSGTNTGDQTITLTGDVTGSGTGSFATSVGRINGTTLSGLATGILKNTTATGVPSIAIAGDFPTLNQNTTGSAATLTTPRNIHGGSFNGSGDVTNIIASTFGGTGNGFSKLSGATGTEKTYTLPDISTTILTKNYTGSLASGILKSTTATGDLSIALNSDLPTMTATVGGAVPTPPNNTTTFLRGDGTFATPAGGGTVTAVSVATANGFSGTSSGGATPALTIIAGAIVPTSVNGVVLSGSATPTLAVSGTTSVSGTNTGDQTNITGNAGTVTTNANLTGPVTSIGNATTIAAGVITNAMLTNVATATFKGRTTAGTGVPEDLTVAQAKALLNLAGTNTGDQTTITGNAGTATALATGRTIAITGDVTYTSQVLTAPLT